MVGESAMVMLDKDPQSVYEALESANTEKNKEAIKEEYQSLLLNNTWTLVELPQNKKVIKWLRAHPGRVVTHLQISSLFNEAYGKAATIQNACHGFKSTGLWPINPDVFPDYLFAPAETTNIQIVYDIYRTSTAGNNSTDDPATENSSVPATIIDNVPVQEYVEDQPQPLSYEAVPGTSTNLLAFPLEVLSPPKGKFISGQGKRKPKARKSHLMLTSTPNMQESKIRWLPKIHLKRGKGKS